MPIFGFGTYQARGSECYNAVLHAIQCGYRLIDTAAIYRNERDVGAAVKQSGVPREQLFVTSKLSPNDQGSGAYDACMASLRNLGMDYLDLYLIHWPGTSRIEGSDPRNLENRRASWMCLQRLLKDGKVRAIGVSNYTPRHLAEMAHYPGFEVPPAVNQIELHPLLQQRELRRDPHVVATPVLVPLDSVEGVDSVEVAAIGMAEEQFEAWGVVLQAYSSLAQGDAELLDNAVLHAVANAHNHINTSRGLAAEWTTAQVALRWALQHRFPIIPKTVSLARVEENLRAAVCSCSPSARECDGACALTQDEMNALDGLEFVLRCCWDPNTIA